MASRFKATALKDAAENLNMRKNTINWVRVFENWFDENGLRKNPETVRPEQLDKVLVSNFERILHGRLFWFSHDEL